MKGCMVTDTKRWTDERETNREREREREGWELVLSGGGGSLFSSSVQ